MFTVAGVDPCMHPGSEQELYVDSLQLGRNPQQ